MRGRTLRVQLARPVHKIRVLLVRTQLACSRWTGLPRTEPSHQFSDSSSPLNELDVALAEDDRLDATGITRRYRGRVWQRRLRVVHGPAARNSLLTVTDTVRSAVGAEDLRFLWHVGAGLTVEMRTDGAEVFDGPVKVMEIEFHSDAEFTLELVEGSEEPEYPRLVLPELRSEGTCTCHSR